MRIYQIGKFGSNDKFKKKISQKLIKHYWDLFKNNFYILFNNEYLKVYNLINFTNILSFFQNDFPLKNGKTDYLKREINYNIF